MTPEEKRRLKDFIEEHIPFPELKKVGFWPKGTRKTDYEAIANRVCEYFGFESIYEYNGGEIEQVNETIAVARWPPKIEKDGNLRSGDSAIIHTIESEFDCPICTCHQQMRDSDRPVFRQKCKGCKRPLQIFSNPCTGSLTVTEIVK